jgi:hypothetical protein
MEIARQSVSALADKLGMTQEWQNISLDIVSEFIRKNQDWKEDSIPSIATCAALIATKSLNNDSLNKNSSNESKIAVSQFFTHQSSEDVNSMLNWLKLIINEISMDSDVSHSCKEFISTFGFINSFYDKYTSIWDSLGFKFVGETRSQNQFSAEKTLENIKKLGWMIFIYAKFNVLWNKIQIFDCAWMLMATFYVLITNLDTSEVTCKVLNECAKNDMEQNEVNKCVFDSLLKLMVKKNQDNADEDTEPIWISISLLLKMLWKLKESGKLVISVKSSVKLEDDMEVEQSKTASNNIGLKSPGSMSNYDFDSIKGMFNKNNMMTNYDKLYQEYGDEISKDQLDERFFLENNIKTNSITVTPFIRQGHANKPVDQKVLKREAGIEQVANAQFSSKRLLDYNASSINTNKTLTLSSQLKDIKFPSMVQSSPYSIKAFTPATPISSSLEMVNWLKFKWENAKRSLDSEGFPPIMSKHLKYCNDETKERILQNLDSWVAKIDYEYKNDYSRSVAGNSSKDSLRFLYLKLVDELLLQEENNTMARRKLPAPERVIKELSKTLYRIEFHKAVFTCAAETMLFIYNEQQPGFEQLLEFMNLSVFDFWKLVNSFIVVDPQMPTPLKRHFRDIEIKIVTELGWKNNTAIMEYQNEVSGKIADVEMQVQTPPDDATKNASKSKESAPGSGESPMTEEDAPNKLEEDKDQPTKPKRSSVKPLELFFRRVLHKAAFKILTISEELELNDIIKEQMWEIMKHWLSSATDLLYNRHLDQLVLWTIYGVWKIQNDKNAKPVKFNDIIKKYKELQNKITGASVQTFQNMYTHVRLEDEKKGNIIEFYNKIYIPQMKVFIMRLDAKNTKGSMLSPKPKIWALAPTSPLRENLPPACLTYSTIYSSRGLGGTPSRQGIITPGMRRVPMMAMTPRTKTLYNFGESQTSKLDDANDEIRKNWLLFKQSNGNMNFGAGASKGKLQSVL